MQFYLNPEREQEANALPNGETFDYSDCGENNHYAPDGGPGWYWQPCLPSGLPHGDPIGPFNTEALAIADAQGGVTTEEPNPFADIDRSPTAQGGVA